MTRDESRERPSGSNADEWHLFLTKHLDNRAGNNGLTYMAVQIAEAIEANAKQELFDVGGGLAVAFNPHGQFHGWLFRQHPDGQYVPVHKLNKLEPFA
jgi:hypothetical protein